MPGALFSVKKEYILLASMLEQSSVSLHMRPENYGNAAYATGK